MFKFYCIQNVFLIYSHSRAHIFNIPTYLRICTFLPFCNKSVMLKDKFGVPVEYGWKARGDWKPKEIRSPYIRLSWRQFCDVIPYIIRFLWYWLKKFRDQESIFINCLRPLSIFPYFGVPCGGIGSGCIGRDFRGAFCKFTMRPGLVEYNVTNVPENQFIVNIRCDNKTMYQRVLTAAPQQHRKLKAWRFDFTPENLQYTGLFPRAWTVYSIPEYNIKLCCRQTSPVIPHDYRDACLPVTIFEWIVENYGQQTLDIAICSTFRNGTGDPRWQKEGPCLANRVGAGQVGVGLRHTVDGMRCEYGLAAEPQPSVEITYSTFDVTKDGGDLWNDLFENGQLSNSLIISDNTIKNELGIALCCSLTVESQSVRNVKTCLAWHMPEVWFGGKARMYRRKYAKCFKNAGEICEYALKTADDWEQKIDEWQDSILEQKALPNSYKNALLNELYYLVDSGSVWFEFEDDWRLDEPHLSDYTCDLLRQYGRFAYLESFEYRMYNTYDVHFYSSFAFACLFPHIEQCIQAEYCDQIGNEDLTPFKFFYSGDKGVLKQKFRVPHDLGCPGLDPWLHVNAYVAHNSAIWKDLNLKFVLTSMRDYSMLKTSRERSEFLAHVWPNVKILIDVGLKQWDVDGDGMIENSGTCDQTYDTWKMSGTSAYCGSLWLAALKCGVEMAQIMEDDETEQFYEKILGKAKIAFEKKLWTGEYYRFDEFSVDNDVIMADQLCGFWYLRACGITDNVFNDEHAKLALRRIYDYNAKQFGGGKLGFVNGRHPQGTPDRISMQAEEVWTGVSYALCSLMVDQGMKPEAFSVASAMHDSVFGPLGMQFQTPEALYEQGFYRGLGYMRALAVWAIHWMLNRDASTKLD